MTGRSFATVGRRGALLATALLVLSFCLFGGTAIAAADSPSDAGGDGRPAETGAPMPVHAHDGASLDETDDIDGADDVSGTFAVMPNLRGMNYADALVALERLGLTDVHVVKYTDQGDVEFNPFGVLNPRNWTVVSQSIEPGTPLLLATGTEPAQTDAEKVSAEPDAAESGEAAADDAAAEPVDAEPAEPADLAAAETAAPADDEPAAAEPTEPADAETADPAATDPADASAPPQLTLSLVRCAIGIQGFDIAEMFSHLPFQ